MAGGSRRSRRVLRSRRDDRESGAPPGPPGKEGRVRPTTLGSLQVEIRARHDRCAPSPCMRHSTPPFKSRGRVSSTIRMPLPAIELQQLWKSYDGQPALQGLSLEAYPSGILGLIGPNGAGKTTTLKILVGLLRPDYGIVRVRGHDVLVDPVGYKAELGYMPEAPTLPEYLTPTEFLGYVGRIRNLPKDRIAARTSEL